MLNGVSWLYGKIIESRNSLYNRGALKSHKLPAPTISVGNITVGGTGKTPLVAYIADYLFEKGETVCIISRGYKRKNESERVLVSDLSRIHSTPEEAGDEPFELAKKLKKKAIVISDKNRVAAAKWAANKFDVTAIVLDDAFQHRKAGRELDLLVVDSTNPFGNKRTIPGGILREPLKNLARADAVVLSRTEQVGDSEGAIREISAIAPNLPIFSAKTRIRSYVSLAEFYRGDLVSSSLPDERTIAFCGIGNPGSFSTLLVKDDINLVDTLEFDNHYSYTKDETRSIEKTAEQKETGVLVTTAKDAVKLRPDQFSLPCFVCLTDVSFDNEKGFADLIDKALS